MCYSQFFLIKSLKSVVWIALTFYNQFIIISLFNDIIFTSSLCLLKSTRVSTNLSTSSLSTLLFKLLKTVGVFSNLSISHLSISDFKHYNQPEVYLCSKFHFSVTPAAFFKFAFVT